jgi:predicted permease
MGIPYWVDWSMDVTSLMYLLTISVLAGILFGLAPALQISKTHVTQGLKETGHQASSGRHGRVMTNAIVAAEISLTLVLMVGAGLFVRSLMTLQSVNVGFQTSDLLTATVPLSETKYLTVADRAAFVDRLTDRLATAPELAAFTFASEIPAGGAGRRRLKLADRNIADGDGGFPPIATLDITPGYFHALGLTMPRGREFAATDGADGAEAAIVNDRFAAQYWPGEDPIGKKIQLGPSPWITVVGVSPTIRQTSLRRDVEAMAYVPFRQSSPFWFRLIARARASQESAASALRDETRKVDSDVALLGLQTFDQFLDKLSLETKILSTLYSMFALIGLVLSAVGIYAVTAYATSLRTQEIGVRIALGASRRDVVWLVLRSGLTQLAVALPIGLAGALGMSRLLAKFLFEVAPLDVATFVAIPVTLAVIVLVACLVPAWRAGRVNPVEALRA